MLPGRASAACAASAFAQWSPAGTAGSTSSTTPRRTSTRRSRNGVRPERPEAHVRASGLDLDSVLAAMESGRNGRKHIGQPVSARTIWSPQWSPAGTAGSTRSRTAIGTPDPHAAMESGRNGRKHARLVLGEDDRRHPDPHAAMESGRNGRKHVLAGLRVPRELQAAMESGRNGRKHGSRNSSGLTCVDAGCCERWPNWCPTRPGVRWMFSRKGTVTCVRAVQACHWTARRSSLWSCE